MTKAELVDHVAATVQLPKHQIETVLTQFLQGIMDALQAGDKVELRGFGSFRLRHRQAREGRNPRTGDTVPIPAKAVPRSPREKPSKRRCKPAQHLQIVSTVSRASTLAILPVRGLVRRAWTACAVTRGYPRSPRLTTAIMAASHASARSALLALFGRGGLLGR